MEVPTVVPRASVSSPHLNSGGQYGPSGRTVLEEVWLLFHVC